VGVTEKAAGAVVVGVDGSDTSLHALEWAAEQAELEERPLTLVHAATLGDVTATDIAPATISSVLRAEGRTILAAACDRVRTSHEDLTLRSELCLDDPRTVLLEASRHAHLLVVGSRGRGPVKSLLLGSAGVYLTQHARCPVVVRRPSGKTGGCGVLVGTDGLRHSEPAVDWAFRHAALRGMPLTLVRTVFDGLPAGEVRRDEPGHDELWHELDTTAAEAGRRHGPVEVTLRLERGLADEALLRVATGMDLVVVGGHVRRSVLGLLDLDVATSVVEKAPGFVAVVPGPD
jgi:nucleotide-binding universal stress UspA family protein